MRAYDESTPALSLLAVRGADLEAKAIAAQEDLHRFDRGLGSLDLCPQ
jgi:hypothetical protein